MAKPSGDVLVILGGAGVGKSTVSRYCAIRWPAKRYVDIGTVREVLRPEIPELELSTYAVWRLAGDSPSPDNFIAGFEKYVALMWPAVARILKRTALEENNLVLDGAMMSPHLLDGLEIARLRVHPRMLYLSDEAAHFARLRSSVKSGSSQEKRLVESFPLVRALQEYLAAQCRARGIPIIENRDLEETLAAILKSLPPAE